MSQPECDCAAVAPTMPVYRVTHLPTCALMRATVSARWGVYDRVDRCWLGTNDEGTGPRVWDDEIIARASENIARVRLGYPACRLTVRQYDGSGTKEMPPVEPSRSFAEAMDLLGWNQNDIFTNGPSATPLGS